MRRTAALLAIVVTLVATPGALAAGGSGSVAAPGVSAVDQYREAVPGASGPQAPGGGAAASKAAAGGAHRAIPRRTLDKLEHAGRDGRAAAALAGELTPPNAARPDRARPGATRLAASSQDGVLSSLGKVFTGQGGGSSGSPHGIGLALPLVLLGAALGAALLLLVGRRRRSG